MANEKSRKQKKYGLKVFISSWPNYKSGGILRDYKMIRSSFLDDETFEVQEESISNQYLQNRLFRKVISLLALFGLRANLRSKDYELIFLPQVGQLFRHTRTTLYVIRVHDVFPVTNPEWFELLPRWNFRRALIVSVRYKKVLYLCNSKTTQKNLLNAFPDKSLKTLVYPCQVSVMNEKNCSECSACVTREVLPNKFLLMVGTIEPRKDYAFILNVIKKLGDRSLPIIVVGRVGWKSKETIRDLKHSNKVIWYKDACDGSLIHLYQAAVAFISTSLDEGFNLPAAEAHQFGTPLLLRNIEIHQEFHSEHAKFFSNELELANLIIAPSTYPRKNNPLRSGHQDKFPKRELLNILNHMRVD